MGVQDHIDWLRTRAARTIDDVRMHPSLVLRRTRRLMASIVAWLIGLLFLGVGCWILLLRFEGLVDRVRPHTMSIGHMTVDGADSRGHAELLRARFDHHFRRPLAIPKETGFLEVMSLDALIADCGRLEARWVAHQRVFQVQDLNRRARRLTEAVERATLEDWREIQIPFL